MSEQWRDVVGWEKLYEVSDHGRVRSLDRHITCVHPNYGKQKRVYRGRFLKPGLDRDGYLIVGLCRDGKAKTHKVARLVALAFHGKSNKPTVNHKDGCKENNAADNLEWATRSEQNYHAWGTGLRG